MVDVPLSSKTIPSVYESDSQLHLCYFVLEPGDLIWFGTMGSTQAMEPGDVYEVEISGVGTLRNEVVQGK